MREKELTKPKQLDDDWVVDVITDSDDEPPRKNPKGIPSTPARPCFQQAITYGLAHRELDKLIPMSMET